MSTDLEPTDPLLRANMLDLLERLADDLAHEIKNPLHSMVINLEVLKRRVARPEMAAPEDSMRYIGVLATELERVSYRVELMLRLLRPARRAEPVGLNDLVEELLALIELEARRRRVTLDYAPGSATVPARVPRDPARQIILNLVLAALAERAPGETLRLRTERSGECARLVVQGTELVGVGYPAEAVEPVGPRDELALVRSLCATIGGSLERAVAPEDGALVLSLPLLHG